MNAKARVLVCALCVAACAAAAPAGSDNAIEIVRYENQFSRAHLEPGRLEDRPGIAVVFEGTQDLHYYARSETAPAPGFNLKIVASADGAAFAEPVYPPWKSFYDTAQQKTIEVHVGDFTGFVERDIFERDIVFRKDLFEIAERFGGFVLEYCNLHLICVFPGR